MGKKSTQISIVCPRRLAELKASRKDDLIPRVLLARVSVFQVFEVSTLACLGSVIESVLLNHIFFTDSGSRVLSKEGSGLMGGHSDQQRQLQLQHQGKRSHFDIFSATSEQMLNLLVMQNTSAASLTSPNFQMPENLSTKCIAVKLEIPLRCEISFIDYEVNFIDY